MEVENGERKEVDRPFETFGEKLNFLHQAFISETREIKPTKEVAEPGEEVAEETFGGDLFIGKLKDEVIAQIKEKLGVDITSNPDFRLEGQFNFEVWEAQGASSKLYLLRREVEGETEILAYEEALLELFELAEGLERV